MSFIKRAFVACLIAAMAASPVLAAQDAMKPGEMADHGMVPTALVGAWTLVRCDNVYPDGHRVELYGPNPTGMWLIDAQGDYMMQIVRAKRLPFAANDKSKGTPEEYRAASMDSNAHYGHVSADDKVMHSDIVHASFPNWDGRSSQTSYTLQGDELTYRVAKPSSGAAEGAYGEVVWRRVRS
ncbi:lipocalin-like domain-containing protein [Dyella telluris]|uniref:Lipocalin-like domain-containing protein n=1 Tax=Dyella telluris TaxID=2763498 RepID=A0A7G8Q1M8_9GAMM|nr:lipocalin-like domain-containing protein [Dyella telluris]QNK00686.1 lipocalin-like domain-containing protein [Dyella telluris]